MTTNAPATANTESAAPPAPPAPPAPSAPLAVTTAPPRIQVQFDPNDPVSLYMDTGIFEQLQRVARMMASSSLVPEHLRSVPKRGDAPAIDKTPDCFLVAAQAFRWRMDCFAVAQHTFVLSGRLGYEGKLIAGLINASGRLEANLLPVYSGEKGKNERGVRIVGRIRGEAKDREIDGTVAGWRTQNVKWNEIPDQMLFYRGAREWARRHMPEVMLGISADEEVVEAEAVNLQRNPSGGFMAPRSLDALTDKLAGESTAAAEVATSSAPAAAAAPPSTSPGTVPYDEAWEAAHCKVHGPTMTVVQSDGSKACDVRGCKWTAPPAGRVVGEDDDDQAAGPDLFSGNPATPPKSGKK